MPGQEGRWPGPPSMLLPSPGENSQSQLGQLLPGLSKDEVHVTGPGERSLQHSDGNSRQDKGRVKRFVDVAERTTSEPAPPMEKRKGPLGGPGDRAGDLLDFETRRLRMALQGPVRKQD